MLTTDMFDTPDRQMLKLYGVQNDAQNRPQIARQSRCLGFRIMLKMDILDTPDRQIRAVWGSEWCSTLTFLTPQIARYLRCLGFRLMLKMDMFDTPDRQTIDVSGVQNDAHNGHV